MSPLTDIPKSSLVASAQVPSPALSDDEVLGSKAQNTTASDAPDHEVHGTPYYERQMGDSEVSYYLQSRATGVNDMYVFPPVLERTQFTYPDRYLHLGFKAPMHLVLRPRLRAAWAILRMRHPLLASHVVMQDYDNIKFVYVVVLLRAKGFRRSVHSTPFVLVASTSRHLPKTLWRAPTDSSTIDIRTRMVCTDTGILACPH